MLVTRERRSGWSLLPAELTTIASVLDRADWVATFGDTLFLLVRLKDPTDELALGLVQGSLRDATALARASSEHTAALALEEAGTFLRRPPPSTGSTVAAVFDAAPCFVAPLRRRHHEGRVSEERLWIGRSPTSDIVLRHRSVSRHQHAFIILDEMGRLLVGDGGSRNFSFLNDAKLGKQARLLRAGDTLRIGEVEASVASADALWDAINVVGRDSG